MTITTTIRPPGGAPPLVSSREHELASGTTVLEWDVPISNPKLWWPWELGEQPLYRVAVSVEVDGSISGIWERTIGLREIKLSNFVLSVNGQRLFARGANLWPTTALAADASPELIRGDVARAKDLGLNLLRVESHVARPELYEAADRAGVLLWQDLPLRGEAKRSVQSTAVEAAHRLVDKLGGHPSVAIWCAHYDPTGSSTPPATGNGGARPPRPVRRGKAAGADVDQVGARPLGGPRLQPSRSKPTGHPRLGCLAERPRFDGTDTHVRFGWNGGTGRDLESFARHVPRMVRWVSSLGAQSIPESDDVRINDWPADLGLLAERYGLNEPGFRQYVPTSAFPTSDDWIAASQAYQGTVLRRQIETLRRLKYAPTGGFTFAALADARPAISFAIFDHERKPKQAVGAVRASVSTRHRGGRSAAQRVDSRRRDLGRYPRRQ